MSKTDKMIIASGKKKNSAANTAMTVFVYVVCILIAILCIFPFWAMIVNATRSSAEIQQRAVALIPSSNLMQNYKVLQKYESSGFRPLIGFKNSMIISTLATVCSVYFSTLTAYAIVVYDWKLKRAFFSFVMAVMMVPGQIVVVGFYQMIFKVHLNNTFLPFIIPAIAAPSMVFFMKQYMEPSLSLEIVQSARIDGAKEFFTFNMIALPIMKPAIATQAIFSFVSNWNQLFLPLILLKGDKRTMPVMVSLLKGDIYRTEYGSIYLGLTLTVLPLFIVYFALSKYIIAGVALGSVKG
ncbi:MAG: carbohydrate ABC transporter permease [Lachnospiraceae bacterium]|nr:carbohydrate ABC transporter permease [Lachnospiraceae bacterium]